MELLVLSGANGSGKTTFAQKYLKKYFKSKDFINANLIARGISP